MKGVKNYLKNVAKSTVYLASDTAANSAENLANFSKTNGDVIKEAYYTVRHPKAAATKMMNAVKESKLYEAVDYGVKNTFEDLKTGNFYNKERAERDEGKFFGLDASDMNDLSEFGIDDNFDMESATKGADISDGEKAIVDAVSGSNKAMAVTTANAVIASADASIKNQRASTSILYKQNQELFGRLHDDMGVLNSTMQTITKLQAETLGNIDKNISDFFSQSLKIQTENNAMIKEILEMERNKYKDAMQKDEELNNKGKKKRGYRYSDIADGTPDIGEYFQNVKYNLDKKIKDTFSFIPSFGAEGDDVNEIAGMMVSPLKDALQVVVDSMIPKIAKEATKEFDSTIGGIFGNLMGRLTNATRDDDNVILKTIGEIFGVRSTVRRGIDTGKYTKGPVPFDGITRKAITEVIPAHLRRIEAALTGGEEMLFDYNTGRWVRPKDVKQQYQNIRKSAIRSGTSDIIEKMDTAIKDTRKGIATDGGVEAQKEFDKAIEEFREFLYDRNGIFNPALTADQNKINYKYPNLRKYYKEICAIYSSYDLVETKDGKKARHTDLSTRINISNNVLQAADREERQYRDLEKSLNVFTQYFSNGGVFNTHGTYKGEKKDKWTANNMGFMKAVDNKGNNIFDYMQNITKELQWQREFMSQNGFGGGPGGGKKKNKRGRSNSSRSNIPDFSRMSVNKLDQKTTGANSVNKDEAALKEAVKAILKGDTIDFSDYDTEFDDESKKFVEDLSYTIQKKNSDEYKRLSNAAANDNMITKIVNKKYEVSKDSDKLNELVDDVIKEQKEKDKEDDEKEGKEEGVFKRLYNQTEKARNFFSNLVTAPGEIFADVLYSADRSIYDMLYKNEIKNEDANGDKKNYNGFMDMLVGETKKKFKDIGDRFKEMVDGLKEKFGIGEDFGDRTKDAVKKLGTNIMGKVIEANRDVYAPAADYLNEKFGLNNKIVQPVASKLYNSRSDNRSNTFNSIKKVDNMTLTELISRGQALGMDTTATEFRSGKPARGAIKSRYYEMVLDSTKGGTEFNNQEQIKQFFNLMVETGAEIEEAQKIAKNNGLSIRGDSRKEIILNLYKDVFDKHQKETKDLLKKIEEARKEKKLTGDIGNESWTGLYEQDTLKRGMYENSIKQNAKGTFMSIPFKGKTMLSKGEMVFNNKGVGVVNKTDAYNLTEPTHILSSYDSNPILKSMGMDPGKRRTPYEDLANENKIKNKLFNGKNIANHAGGSSVSFENNTAGIDFETIKKNAKEYAPEGVAGGIVGGIVSTLFGIVGGPLIGAAVGAAGNIIANSDNLKNRLFGTVGADGKRAGGLVNRTVLDALERYVPDALKYGAAGIIPGLLTPLGPIGGILVGGAIGALKNNEAFTNKYFGENGKLSFDTKTKKSIENLIPGAAKGAAAAAIGGTLFGGPFGLLGNAALGAGVGMMLSTEDFKDAILGKEINGSRVGGILGEFKDLLQPLKDTGKTIADKLVRAFDDGVVDPLARFIKPAIQQLPRVVSWLPNKIADVISNKVFSEDNFVGKWVKKITKPIIEKGGALAGGVIDAANYLSPFRLLGRAGDKIRKYRIKHGEEDTMTAQERIMFMGDNKATDYDKRLAMIGSGAEGAMSLDEAKELRSKLLATRDNTRTLTNNLNKKQKDITGFINNFATKDGNALNDKSRREIIDALKADDMNQVMAALNRARLNNGNPLTAEEKNTFLNGTDETRSSSFFDEYNQLKDLRARKEAVGSYGGKSIGKFGELKAELEQKLGTDVVSKIKNYRDLDRVISGLNTEIINREANGIDVEVDDPELKEMQEQTKIQTTISDKLDGIIAVASGDMTNEEYQELFKNGEKERKNQIDKLNEKQKNKEEERYASREEQLRKYLGDEYDKLDENVKEELLNGSNQDLYNEIIGVKGRTAEFVNNTVQNTIPFKFRKIKDKASRKFNFLFGDAIDRAEDENYVSSVDQAVTNASNSVAKGASNLKNGIQTRFKKIGNSLAHIGSRSNISTAEGVESAAGSKSGHSKLMAKLSKFYGFEKEAAEYIANAGTFLSNNIEKIYFDGDVKLVLTSPGFGGCKPISEDDVKLINNKTAKEIPNKAKFIVRAVNSLQDRAAKMALGRKFLSISDIYNTSYSDLQVMVNKAQIQAQSQQTEEAQGEEVESHGLGTFLLSAGSTALKVGSAAVKGITGLGSKAINGISSLASKLKSKGGAEAGAAASPLGGLLGGNTGGGSSDDVEVSGNNVVREDGNSMKMKKDANGTLVPDTSDSNTKKTLNLVAMKDKALKKAQAAQSKVAEVLSNAFSNPEAKKKKMNWLTYAISGFFLAKSGILGKLFENVVKPLYNKIIKPIWTEHIHPWITDSVIPWFKNTAWPFVTNTVLPWFNEHVLPAITSAATAAGKAIISALPDALKEVFEELFPKIFGGNSTDGAGTTATGDSSKLNDNNVYYDSDGNEITQEEAMSAGTAVKNRNGDTVEFNEDGTYTVTDGTNKYASGAKNLTKTTAHIAANRRLGLGKVTDKTFKAVNKVNKVLVKRGGILGKAVGYAGKAFMAPLNAVNSVANGTALEKGKKILNKGKKIGKAAKNSVEALANTRLGKAVSSKAEGLISKGKSVTSKASDTIASKAEGLISKGKGAASKASDTIMTKAKGLASKAKGAGKKVTDLFNNKNVKSTTQKVAESAKKAGSTVKDKIGQLVEKVDDILEKILTNEKVTKVLKSVGDFLHVDDLSKWVVKFKNNVSKILKNYLTGGVEKAGANAVKEGLGKAVKVCGGVLSIAIYVSDFVLGMDQAESILGVSDTSILEEFACGLVNMLCNLLIVPSIWPGTNKLARDIVGLFDDTLAERQEAADKEYEEYKEETGELTLTKEEYLKEQKSVSGKLFSKAKSVVKKGASAVASGIKSVYNKAKSGVSSLWNTITGGSGKNTTTGTGKYGRAKQIDPSISGIRFNAPGDTTYQTIGDSGCGPAAAVTAVQSMYGRSTNPVVQAADYAVNRGYKEKDGGTKPGFFGDYFNQNGLGSSTTSNKSTIEANIKSGKPTVLMGQDKAGTSSSTPYGKNPHYVTATGTDGRGNVIIQDPESKYNNQVYPMKNVINKSSIGVSATGRGKNYISGVRSFSKYGRSKYGMGTDYQPQIWAFLTTQAGLTEIAAAGVMGCWQAESSNSPRTVEGYYLSDYPGDDVVLASADAAESYTTSILFPHYAKSSSINLNKDAYKYNGRYYPGIGLAQWTGPRCGKLLEYAQKNGGDWGTLDTQLNFFLNGSGEFNDRSGLKDNMNKCTSTDASTKLFYNTYEGCTRSDWLSTRRKYAKTIYNKFKGQSLTYDGTTYSSDSSSSTSSTSDSTSSASDSIIGKISDMVTNSRAFKALELFTGATDSSSSSDSSSTDSTSTDSSTSTSGTASGGDAAKVINAAAAEVGYKEKASKSNLDDKTANAGSGNYTKFNEWYGMQGQPWCAMFSSWAADQAGVSTSVIPKDAYTKTQYAKIAKSGSKVEPADTQPGDYVYFTKGGASGIYHVGIAEANDNGTIRTIEGNSSNAVSRRSYGKDSYGKLLIARPNYADKTAVTINTDSSEYVDEETTESSATGNNSNKPMSKYGIYKESNLKKVSLKSNNDRFKSERRDSFNPYQAPGYANTTSYGKGSNDTNYSNLIESVIDILMTIADNTDKLNTIVTILNDKLGIDVSKELNNKNVTKNTKKKALRKALTGKTQANTTIDSTSINFIMNSMNQLASE